MRALRVEAGTTALVEIAEPSPAGEAVVRVVLSGICNTDLELARGYAGFRGTLGHEFVGIVEDPGGGPLARGQRVVGEINAGCGSCALCASGDARHCPARTVLGIVGRDGAHADRLRLPARNLIAVPASVPDRCAVFVEPLAAACGVLERCPVGPGAQVAILGDGKLGLLCALALAPHRPVLVGKHPAKLALARAVETSSIDDARRRGRGFDIVIEATGGPSGFELALDLVRPQGTIVLKSTFHGGMPLDTSRIVVDEIRVVGSRCGRFAPALDLLAREVIEVEPLISDVMPLDQAAAAMRQATMPGALKILLAP